MTPEQYTLVGLLIAIGIAGAAQKWVFGWVYQAQVRETQFWRRKYLRLLGVAEIATDEAEKRADDD